jgi:predicted glycogen debranching enzyme
MDAMNTVPAIPPLALGRESLGSFEAASGREWLVTNGLGGFAAGTISGANTRRYHGLLIAALQPPVARTLLVAQLDATVIYRGRRIDLSSNEYIGGSVHPDGWRRLAEFRLEGTLPVWRWIVDDATIERRVWMAHGRNTTYVRYTVIEASASLTLELAPLCAHRDYHSHQRGRPDYRVSRVANGVRIDAWVGAPALSIFHERGDFVDGPEVYWNFHHRREVERGLDDGEDLFRPGHFVATQHMGDDATLVLTAERDAPQSPLESYAAECARQQRLLDAADASAAPADGEPAWIRRLVLAADQFVVERRASDRRPLGDTVIAGYPWFADWGRDTMIALPGLTLACGRPELTARILRTFAQFVSEGMLPNRFPDSGEPAEYNTVDATLWYFVAVESCWRATRDRALLAELYPVLEGIVAAHERGTRYGIRVDEADGLLAAGVPGVQLTWMDAKVGDWVVTPRIGKPVEINALWFNALLAMRDFAGELGRAEEARRYLARAERVARSFDTAFWLEDAGYLCDVVDGPEGELAADGRRRDRSLRPNQVFALSLPHPLLDNGRARAVVDVCARELWTPVGLRSLGRDDPRYAGRYVGGPRERDGVYHQGTVWSWLAGPFALAHYRAYGDAARARALLAGLGAHLAEACLGQVSEIFDGDAPHAPRGCVAQAWSVAETLRVWRELNECQTEKRRRGSRRRRPVAG